MTVLWYTSKAYLTDLVGDLFTLEDIDLFDNGSLVQLSAAQVSKTLLCRLG